MDDGKPTRYVRCSQCGTVYASPRSSHPIRYAWLDAVFGAGPHALQNETSRRPALVREAQLIQQLMQGGSLLDIGCDTGAFFEWFYGKQWRRYGVELSPSAAAYAAQVYQAEVFPGTLSQAGYPPAMFDVITMIDMLYYVDDPNAEFQEVRRVLKPGGFVAIELAGQRYQLSRSRGALCWLIERQWTRLQTDSAYLYWFSPPALERLLQRHGLQVMAWHIITSPTQRGWLPQALTDTYFKAITWFARRSRRALTWAPKYFCIARL
jgi:SAM-dependent methyltransferase